MPLKGKQLLTNTKDFPQQSSNAIPLAKITNLGPTSNQRL
jgi:hypothetical protein